MSVDLDVFIERSRLPGFGEWTEAISREGFALSFPEAVDLAKHTGYLPAMLGGEDSGFEFFLSNLDKADEMPDEVESLLPAANAVANFNCHGMQECLAATAAAAVLAQLTGGVFFDPQGGGAFRGQDAIAQAKAQLAAAAKKEAEDVARHGKLSPAKWAEAFEETLRRVNPDYGLNKDFRGSLVECLREDTTGLFLSQNCVKMHDSYRHCFAVLLTRRKLRPVLYSPFVLGSRFDNNCTIAHAYSRDYRAGLKWRVAPKEWHSEYRATTRGTQQWVETTAKSAEQFLFPLYLRRLANGAERIASLLRDAASYIEQWGVSLESLNEPVRADDLTKTFAAHFHLTSASEDWNEGLVAYYNALRLAQAHGVSGARLLDHRQDAINSCDDVVLACKKFTAMPDEIRNAAIFVRYAEDFLTVHDELPRMLRVIETVKGLSPALAKEPTSSQKPWWRFWT